MTVLNILETSLPLTNPVLKFLILLFIILTAPILLNRLKIPHILGLIIAGAIIGPNGFNFLLRDSGIILSGTAGLLYIMFLAGLDINILEFKKNSSKSLLFGMYTFIIPMVLGTVSGLYVLNLSPLSSVLVASMYASHTLIAYPILSKLGITKNRAVNVAVGGTMITDILALLVLAVIIGMAEGEINTGFWMRISVSMVIFGFTVLMLFPIVGRWFLKRYDDNVSQYIFVLVMVFLGAVLAEIAGLEAIIGAFLTGLALSRLIPSFSPLKSRIEFVGNAIFIPIFLIGVGMLIDFRAFFKDFETIKVAVVMTTVATSAKFIAAWLTQKTLKYSADERRIIFGLSNAQAAATLAAVLIGYNVILGETATGEPIRLLNDSILNGTIIMILVTCTFASFSAQKGGRNISFKEISEDEKYQQEDAEKILVPVNNPDTIDELIQFSTIIKSRNNKKGLFALNVKNNYETAEAETDNNAAANLKKAAKKASQADIQLNEILRYDINIVNGITGIIKEYNITDLVLGLHVKKGVSESFIGRLTERLLAKCNTTTFVYKSVRPVSTTNRFIVVVPPNAEKVAGFYLWLSKIANIPQNTGSGLIFYAGDNSIKAIRAILSKQGIVAEFKIFEDWSDFSPIANDIKIDDNLVIVLSRINKPSYNEYMQKIPEYIGKYFQNNNFILVYPLQIGVVDDKTINLVNPSLTEPFERLNDVGKTIVKYFKKE